MVELAVYLLYLCRMQSINLKVFGLFGLFIRVCIHLINNDKLRN